MLLVSLNLSGQQLYCEVVSREVLEHKLVVDITVPAADGCIKRAK
jgi:hypothetical protein